MILKEIYNKYFNVNKISILCVGESLRYYDGMEDDIVFLVGDFSNIFDPEDENNFVYKLKNKFVVQMVSHKLTKEYNYDGLLPEGVLIDFFQIPFCVSKFIQDISSSENTSAFIKCNYLKDSSLDGINIDDLKDISTDSQFIDISSRSGSSKLCGDNINGLSSSLVDPSVEEPTDPLVIFYNKLKDYIYCNLSKEQIILLPLEYFEYKKNQQGELNIRDKKYFSTGCFSIDFASYFHPINIDIYGMDFYRERNYVDLFNNKDFIYDIIYNISNMTMNLNDICSNNPDINFNFYTSYPDLLEKGENVCENFRFNYRISSLMEIFMKENPEICNNLSLLTERERKNYIVSLFSDEKITLYHSRHLWRIYIGD